MMFLLMLSVSLSSCEPSETPIKKQENDARPNRSAQEPKSLKEYLQELPGILPDQPVMLSMIDPDECLNCYPFVFRKQRSFRRHFDLPEKNTLMLFPGVRDREAEAIMNGLLKELRGSSRLILDKELGKLVRKHPEKPYKNSWYLLLSAEGKLLERGTFKKGIDKGAMTDPSFRDSSWGLLPLQPPDR